MLIIIIIIIIIINITSFNEISSQIAANVLEIQGAPLTLRGQRSRYRNDKGNPKYLGAFLAQGYAYFSSGCGFLVGLDKPKLCTKF